MHVNDIASLEDVGGQLSVFDSGKTYLEAEDYIAMVI